MGYREAEGMLKNQTSLSLNSALPHPNFCKWFFFSDLNVFLPLGILIMKALASESRWGELSEITNEGT